MYPYFFAILLALSLFCLVIPPVALAGFDEGLAAYRKKDYATALSEWKPLADHGSAVAQTTLGTMYHFGEGVPQDDREAVKWFTLAARQGVAYGQNALGVMYDNGLGVIKDYGQAVKWYFRSADQGYVYAQFNLGLMYDKGKGIQQDYKNALKWYRLAANQGHAGAQYNLSVMYKNGEGVNQNRVIAYALYILSSAHIGPTERPNPVNVEVPINSITPGEIEIARRLARDMKKPGNLLKTLDKYGEKTLGREARIGIQNDAEPPRPRRDSFADLPDRTSGGHQVSVLSLNPGSQP